MNRILDELSIDVVKIYYFPPRQELAKLKLLMVQKWMKIISNIFFYDSLPFKKMDGNIDGNQNFRQQAYNSIIQMIDYIYDSREIPQDWNDYHFSNYYDYPILQPSCIDKLKLINQDHLCFKLYSIIKLLWEKFGKISLIYSHNFYNRIYCFPDIKYLNKKVVKINFLLDSERDLQKCYWSPDKETITIINAINSFFSEIIDIEVRRSMLDGSVHILYYYNHYDIDKLNFPKDLNKNDFKLKIKPGYM